MGGKGSGPPGNQHAKGREKSEVPTALSHGIYAYRRAGQVPEAYQWTLEVADEFLGEMSSHLGGDEVLTAPEHELLKVAHFAKVGMLLCQREFLEGGLFRQRNGEQRPRVDLVNVYRAFARDLMEILKLLGLERRAKEIPATSAEYFSQKYGTTDAKND